MDFDKHVRCDLTKPRKVKIMEEKYKIMSICRIYRIYAHGKFSPFFIISKLSLIILRFFTLLLMILFIYFA